MIQKISLPILLTIMCVLMAGVVGLAYVNKGYLSKLFSKDKTNKIEEVKITRTDYSQTARKTLDWIDEQRGSDGWYILERGCDVTTKTCDTVWNNDEGNQDGLIATWVRFNFYNQIKDPKDLDIVKKDIDIFYNKYPNGVTNALWICKITYDMYQSNLFDQTTKDKLEKICFNTQFPTPEEVKEIRGKNSLELRKFTNETQVWQSWSGYNLVIRGIDVYFGYPTELMSRYLWSKNSQDLDTSSEYFGVLKEQTKNINSFPIEDRCLIGLSALDIYEFSGKNTDYFNYASSLYEEFIVGSKESRRVVTPMCGLLTKRLFNLTNDKKYLSYLEFFSKTLTEFNMDGGINSVVFDNGFYKSNMGTVYTRNKNVVENALIVELLRN